MGIMYD
jgi:tetratricopeptide (TPR) repeat protein